MVYILFYEDPSPKDCTIYEVFNNRKNAIGFLLEHNWYFDTDNCIWRNEYYRGFIEILERELL